MTDDEPNDIGTEAGRARRAVERARVHEQLRTAQTLMDIAIAALTRARSIVYAEAYDGTAGYLDAAIKAAQEPRDMVELELTDPMRLSYGDRWFEEHLFPEFWQQQQ